MSKIRAKHSPAWRSSQSSFQPLAICSVGFGYCGSFPKAIGNKKYLLIGTDYFTKWVETKPLANIRDVDVKRFIWKSIVTRFRVPYASIPDGNDELLKKSLDLIEERRENAMVQLAYYQHKLKQSYDTNVKQRLLALGDLVLRKVLENTKNPAWGKWRPN